MRVKLSRRGGRSKKIQDYISSTPGFSSTVMKALEICNDSNTSPVDLNRVISIDPVLTGRILRLVNSTFYSFPRKVASVTRAIVMLGLNNVKNLILGISVLENFGRERTFGTRSADEFWSHSIGVGIIAKFLASLKGVVPEEREEYFVAGLLHDIGKIPMNNQFPKDYLEALRLAESRKIPLYHAEKMIFGLDHCTVGRMIGESWRLGETLTDALCSHHDRGRIEKQGSNLLAVVSLADAYMKMLMIGFSGDCLHEERTTSDLEKLVGIEGSVLEGLREMVTSEIEKAKVFLRVVEKEK
ncbi:MAG TPA: HDOD domain-containing protein [Desulfobacteraceae bacterium]|nr:HDOD domain-containing protein [Desulfobacteraceae bacterium]